MSTTADTERRLRDANPTPPDLPKSEAAWSSAELLDRIDLQTRVADAPDSPAFVHQPAHRTRGPLIAIGAALAITLPILLIALFANAGPEGDVAATTTTSPSTVAPAPVPSKIVQIEAFDYGYSGFDVEFFAGDAIELFNRSEVEFHNLVVIRLDDDDIRTVGEIAEMTPKGRNTDSHSVQFIDAGRIVAAIGKMDASPGEDAFNGRIRLQRSGRYIAFDMIPQGADPLALRRAVDTKAPSYLVAGGPLGYQHGMIVEFFVIER
jgi:hypothetical protein